MRSGIVDLAFVSHDPDLKDLQLAGQQVAVTATVTELARAALFSLGGAGTLTGSGTDYTIDLGDLTANTGTLSFSLGLDNAIKNTTWGEQLGGSWDLSDLGAFGFTADPFNLIDAGASARGGVVTFAATGRQSGQYLGSFALNPFSHQNGLVDLQQAAIRIHLTANIADAAVPEPATWLQLVGGLGLAGVALRRRGARTTALRAWS